MGIAIIGAILTTSITATAETQINANQLIPAPVKSQIVQSVNNGTISEGGTFGGSVIQGMQNSAIGKALTDIFSLAFVDGARAAALFASFFVFLGAISSLFIPNTMDRRRRVAVAPE